MARSSLLLRSQVLTIWIAGKIHFQPDVVLVFGLYHSYSTLISISGARDEWHRKKSGYVFSHCVNLSYSIRQQMYFLIAFDLLEGAAVVCWWLNAVSQVIGALLFVLHFRRSSAEVLCCSFFQITYRDQFLADLASIKLVFHRPQLVEIYFAIKAKSGQILVVLLWLVIQRTKKYATFLC